jgi:hypothetical protein
MDFEDGPEHVLCSLVQVKFLRHEMTYFSSALLQLLVGPILVSFRTALRQSPNASMWQEMHSQILALWKLFHVL